MIADFSHFAGLQLTQKPVTMNIRRMNIPLLLSIAAILFLPLVAGFLFRSKSPLTIERVKRNFVRNYPDISIADTLIDGNGYASVVVPCSGDCLGFVFLPGHRVVCRLFRASQIRKIEKRANQILLFPADFTVPVITFSGQAEQLTEIARELGKFIEPKRV